MRTDEQLLLASVGAGLGGIMLYLFTASDSALLIGFIPSLCLLGMSLLVKLA